MYVCGCIVVRSLKLVLPHWAAQNGTICRKPPHLPYNKSLLCLNKEHLGILRAGQIQEAHFLVILRPP